FRQAFPADDAGDLARQIDAHQPLRPTLLEPGLPKDLETVVLKSMSKLRDERYGSAQEFADDLRRVLEGKPTVARPPSVADRLAKWTRRHSRGVVMTMGVSLAAVVGLTGSILIIDREKTNAQEGYARADRDFRQARQTVDRFGAALAERLADVPGAEEVRSDLVRETLDYYRQFVQRAQHDPSLQADLALTYSKMGSLSDEIGSADDAIAAHENALRLF